MENKYADVILPLNVNQIFTYEVPAEYYDIIKSGQRVVVPLKEKKLYTGIIKKIHTNPPSYSTKKIINIIDEDPLINEIQFKLWDWIANYYVCSLGEVYSTAFPSSLIPESEIVIIPGERFTEYNPTTEKEKEIKNIVETRGFIDIKFFKKIIGKKNVNKKIKNYEKNKIFQIESYISNFSEKKIIDFINLKNSNLSENELDEIFKTLKKSKKQLELVYTFIHLNNGKFVNTKAIKKDELLQKTKASESSLKELIKKGIFKVEKKEEIEYINIPRYVSKYLLPLSENQKKIIEKINNLFNEQKPVLLKNTYNDEEKFNILLNIIDDQLRQGKQVLYLLPEIYFAEKTKSSFEKIYGNLVIQYHSDISEGERTKIFLNLGKNNINECLIVGVRNAIFLPLNRLGLIIIDDEHDYYSYKNQSVPYFNTRDVAIVLAKMHNANMLMLSNTPLLESIYNIRVKKFNELKYSSGEKEKDNIIVDIIDLKKERKKGTIKLNFYSDILLDAIRDTLNKNLQVVIFNSRRGYSPYLECEDCTWTAECKNCDVNLVYHKTTKNLVCHYCEYTTSVYHICPMCGSVNIKIRGTGTQRIEDEIGLLIKNVNVLRIDYDSVKNKKKFKEMVEKVKERKVQIITGTQMLTKVVDFKEVGLFVIPDLDSMLYFPDFRATEKVYQLLENFRNKIKSNEGVKKIIIQTNNVNHPVLKYFVANNLEGFYEYLFKERQMFSYPPFARIIKIIILHKNRNKVLQVAEQLKNKICAINSIIILGPQFQRIERIKNHYIIELFIKIPKTSESAYIRSEIYSNVYNFFSVPEFKNIKYYVDVDPV